jgi:hypothetical protein
MKRFHRQANESGSPHVYNCVSSPDYSTLLSLGQASMSAYPSIVMIGLDRVV